MAEMVESINPSYKELSEEQKVVKYLKIKLDIVKQQLSSNEDKIKDIKDELDMDKKSFLIDQTRNYGKVPEVFEQFFERKALECNRNMKAFTASQLKKRDEVLGIN